MQLLHKNFICLLFIICISFSTQAQGTFSNDADAPKIKEIQTSIASLVNNAANNFTSNKSNLLVTYKANDKWVTKYQPKDLTINIYADDAGITEENETKKCFYEATYNNNASIKLAYNAFLTMFLVGKQWTHTSVPTTEKNSIKDLLFFNGQQVGIATNNPARNELYITIGYKDDPIKTQKPTLKKSTSSSSSNEFNRTMLFVAVSRVGATANSTQLSYSIDQTYSTGFGVHFLYLLSSKFAVSLEPMIQQGGYKVNLTNASITYLDVPINIERVKDLPFFTPNDILYIGVGVYGAYALAGKYVNTNSNTTQNINFGNSKTDERTRIDYGVNFNVGLYIGLFAKIGVGFQSGLANVAPKDLQVGDKETKTSNLSICFGINPTIFKKKRK